MVLLAAGSSVLARTRLQPTLSLIYLLQRLFILAGDDFAHLAANRSKHEGG